MMLWPSSSSQAGEKRSSDRGDRGERMPLRAFKKIGRVGTLPALAHTASGSAASATLHSLLGGADESATAVSAPGPPASSGGGTSTRTTTGGGGAFQRWGHSNRRGGERGGTKKNYTVAVTVFDVRPFFEHFIPFVRLFCRTSNFPFCVRQPLGELGLRTPALRRAPTTTNARAAVHQK